MAWEAAGSAASPEALCSVDLAVALQGSGTAAAVWRAQFVNWRAAAEAVLPEVVVLEEAAHPADSVDYLV